MTSSKVQEESQRSRMIRISGEHVHVFALVWFGILLALLVLPGCSLMGLDELRLKRCESDDDCVVFNTLLDVDPRCRAFYCHEGACLRHGEGVEVVDFADNDCDGLIDEPSITENGEIGQTLEASGSEIVTGLSTSAQVAFFSDAEGNAAATWWDEDGATSFAPLAADARSSEMSYWRGAYEPGNPELNAPDLLNPELQPGCYRSTPDEIIEGACDFTEVALGLAGESVMVASVSTAQCSVGQLRVGSFGRGGEPEVVLRGPLRRSNSYLGVDLNATGACTGGSRDGCADSGEPCGAARPSVAVIESNSARPLQALIAYIGAGPSRTHCGGAAVNVEAIAVFQMTGEYGEPFDWVTASGEGIPSVLGQSVGGGPPAAIALGSDGYLVAHGDADGELVLHVISPAEDPSDYDGISCEDPCDGVDYREDHVTAPLSQIASLDPVAGIGSGTVDWVALAPGATKDGELELGIAWREGCGGADEAVYFRRLLLEVSGGLPSSVSEVGDAQRLSPNLSGGGKVGPPALRHTSVPFVVEGFERGGAGPATSESDGGWVVAWAERVDGGSPPRLLARRICELDGLVLDESELIDLTVESTEPDVDGPPPSLHGTMDEYIELAYHDTAAQTIVVGELVLRALTR